MNKNPDIQIFFLYHRHLTTLFSELNRNELSEHNAYLQIPTCFVSSAFPG